MENIEHESLNKHLEQVMQFYAADFLVQINEPVVEEVESNLEHIVNDHELSARFNCYLLKQLAGFLPILENEN